MPRALGAPEHDLSRGGRQFTAKTAPPTPYSPQYPDALMSEPTPNNSPDSPDDILRRLDALRKKTEAPAASVPASDLPNIPAQKVMCVLSRINARQVFTQQSIAANKQELIDLLKELLVKTSTIEAIMPASCAQRSDIDALREQIKIVRQQCADISHRFFVAAIIGAVALSVVILGLGAVVALIAGGQR